MRHGKHEHTSVNTTTTITTSYTTTSSTKPISCAMSGLGNFMSQRNPALKNDKESMPPPSLSLNRSLIPPNTGGLNSPRSRLSAPIQKFSRPRSIPAQATGIAQQSSIVGARNVVDKLGGFQKKDAFDTDLDTETGSDDTSNTLNAVDYNQTHIQNQNREQDDYDGHESYSDVIDQKGYAGENGQYYQNGQVGQQQQYNGNGQNDEESEEEEDDQDMPMQHGQLMNGYNGQHYTQQQTQQYVQPLQNPVIRDFDDIPVRGGSPNTFSNRVADARNIALPTSRFQGRNVQQEQQYDGQDNFAATSVGDEESGSEEEYGDEEEVDQQLNGYAQPQTQPAYQNQLAVHQQQQQKMQQQQRPRPPNAVLGQSKPVHERIAEYKGLTGTSGGAFAPSELDETTTFDPPQPTPAPALKKVKAKAKERRTASSPPPLRKRAASPELDYEKKILYEMPYSELANEPFEKKPLSQRPSTVTVKGKTPGEKLEKAMGLAPEAQAEFLSNLSLKDWEEAGEWFVSKFGDNMKTFVDLRRERRAAAERFEKRLGQRDTAVQRSVERLKNDMANMRKGGEGILRGKSPGGF